MNKKYKNVLFTNRLYQDCFENFFCSARQHNGNNINPILLEFIKTFKKLFLRNYFTHSDKANCINDLNKIVSKNPIDTNKDIN